MPYIPNKGSPSADVWFVVERPLSNDENKGYLFSSGLGFMWDKLVEEVGVNNYHVCSVHPDTDNKFAASNVIAHVDSYKPRIIIPLDSAGRHFNDALMPKKRGKTFNPEEDSEVFKYAGSLLTCENLKYPHYIVPTLGPSLIARQYKLKEQVQLDIAKAVSELEHFRKHGVLAQLPARELKIDFDCFDEQLAIIESMEQFKYVSNDIETLYPKKGSSLYGKHPGYPFIIGLAISPYYSISIDLFRESNAETVRLWRQLDKLFRNTIQIGQNFFNFDLNFYEMLGFRFRTEEIQDTLIRHAVLWPELPHKLQHLTRQYTREIYYKDEGHTNIKNIPRWKRYNALDAAVTYEVYLAQEREFDERPYLR